MQLQLAERERDGKTEQNSGGVPTLLYVERNAHDQILLLLLLLLLRRLLHPLLQGFFKELEAMCQDPFSQTETSHSRKRRSKKRHIIASRIGLRKGRSEPRDLPSAFSFCGTNLPTSDLRKSPPMELTDLVKKRHAEIPMPSM